MCLCMHVELCSPVCTRESQSLISCTVPKFLYLLFCCCWWWFLFLRQGVLLTLQLVILARQAEQSIPVALLSPFSITRCTEHSAAPSFYSDIGI